MTRGTNIFSPFFSFLTAISTRSTTYVGLLRRRKEKSESALVFASLDSEIQMDQFWKRDFSHYTEAVSSEKFFLKTETEVRDFEDSVNVYWMFVAERILMYI